MLTIPASISPPSSAHSARRYHTNASSPCRLRNPTSHFTASAALVLGKGLNLRVGYNHLQRRELRLDNTSGSAGLSFGVMLKISTFQIDYTHATLQAAGSSEYFTIARSLDSLFKKKE